MGNRTDSTILIIPYGIVYRVGYIVLVRVGIVRPIFAGTGLVGW